MRFSKAFLAVMLSGCLLVQGCSVAQFQQVLNEVAPAVLTILQIVALVKGTTVDTSVPTKISADVASLEALYTDFQKASSTAQPKVKDQINTAFAVLQGDLNLVFSVAQVSDKNTQLKIAALIGLIDSAVQIAEAAIPNPTPAAGKPLALTASGLLTSYNKILVAKTGNSVVDSWTPKHTLHQHGTLVRTVTLGLAN